MPLKDLRLTVMTFPQKWEASQISVNVLVLPVGDPTKPLTGAAPQFAGTPLPLEAVLIQGLDQLPSLSVNPASVSRKVLNPPAPGEAEALFKAFALKYRIKAPSTAPLPNISIHKALPQSYMNAFPFEQSRTAQAHVGDGFGCAILKKDPRPKDPPPVKDETSWAEIISFALRQPRLARQLGLLYSFTFAVDPNIVKEGAWLYFDLRGAANPWAADVALTPDLIRFYAARIPALTTDRRLFASVLFPVVPSVSNPAAYDTALPEAENYDDGFAKIVHCDQPTSVDVTSGDETQIVPGADVGVQIGWDDEQVTIWHNRQLETAKARRNSTPIAIDLPLGVLGYRVDVRQTGTPEWESLCAVEGRYKLGSIDERFRMEMALEPSAVRSRDAADLQAWLPRYFAQWRGHSLAVDDPKAFQLTGGEQAAPPPTLMPILATTRLLFGNRYDFRVRLADLTHGGPVRKSHPENPAPASVGECLFQRYIPPKAVRIASRPAAEADDTIRSITDIFIWRPLIHYPECVFAGVDPSAVDRLMLQIAAGKANKAVLGMNDPDVGKVRVDVEARVPAHDTSNPEQLDGRFRRIYSFEATFPPLPADPVPPAPPAGPAEAEAIHLQIDPIDIANIAHLTKPASVPGGQIQPLPIPTSRDVRIRITPLADSAKPDYFGNDEAKIGLTSSLLTNTVAAAENNCYVPKIDADEINAIMLQPGVDSSDLTQRLAQPLEVLGNDLTLAARPGTRIAFGASQGVRFTLSGDHSTITFASHGELLRHWLIAIMLDVDRDWTWNGLADEGFKIERRDSPAGTFHTVGFLRVPQTVSDVALAGKNTKRRESTRTVFFDTVDPLPKPDAFPISPTLSWRITPMFKSGPNPGAVKTFSLTLPIAAPPRQTPQIVSAGYALSPFAAAEDYSSTAPRSRALWLEFDRAPEDDQDSFFARVLHYGADPLLARTSETFADDPQDPALAVDPEPIRVITPGQSIDTAGLDAMVRLVRSNHSDRHYLVPLPPGLDEDSPELFGFWTYEVRAGHNLDPVTRQPVWSTAQARFGRPLRATGVQHPAPQLTCLPVRAKVQNRDGIVVTAPFATPVRGGQKLVIQHLGPHTQIWFMLYAQVTRADAQQKLNVLIEKARGMFPREGQELTRDFYAVGSFVDDEIHERLHRMSIPIDASLSVLAVELLPGGGGRIEDPLGRNLGDQRILRTSPLMPVQETC